MHTEGHGQFLEAVQLGESSAENDAIVSGRRIDWRRSEGGARELFFEGGRRKAEGGGRGLVALEVWAGAGERFELGRAARPMLRRQLEKKRSFDG